MEGREGSFCSCMDEARELQNNYKTALDLYD